jgi:hypothetical protein
LVPVHTISVLGEQLFYCDKDAKRTVSLYDVEHARHLCDGAYGYDADMRLFSLTFLELCKREGAYGNLIHWLDFFNGATLSADAPGYIHEAQRLVSIVNLSEEEYKMISVEERREQDRIARDEWVYLEAFAEGKAEGAEERAELKAQSAELEAKSAELEVQSAKLKSQLDNAVKFMKVSGMDTAAICKNTGLSAEDIAEL